MQTLVFSKPISWLQTLLLFVGMACFSATATAQCSQPSNLNATNLSPTSVELSWSAPGGALNYTLQYRPSTTTVWTTIAGIAGTSQVLTGLAESTVYRWRVKANCSTYSSIAIFNSGGGGNNSSCSQPSNLSVANLSPTSVDLSWSASPGAFNYTLQYRVSGTTAWTTTAPTNNLNLVLTGLLESTVYQWRVKSSCSTYSSIATFNTGGSGGNTECSQPSNLLATYLTPTSSQISWSESPGAFNYRLQYRVFGTTTWTTISGITGLSHTLTGLLENTEYQFRVKASCSVYSSIAVFNTGNSGGGGGTSCSAPSNTNTVAVFPTSANVEWEAVATANNYLVEYRLISASIYTTVGTFTSASASITGLSPGQNYVWRVKANCSPFGSDVQFSTPTSKPGGNAPIFQSSERSMASGFSVFPNPVKNGTVTVRTASAGGKVEILDAAGRVLASQMMIETQENIPVGHLKSGLYFVRLQSENGQNSTVKLLKTE